MLRFLTVLLTVFLAFSATGVHSETINAVSTFRICTQHHATEGELHDDLVASGWLRETLAFDKELFSNSLHLSHEDLSAIFWFSTRLASNQEKDLRYWVEQEFENRSRSDIIVGILASGATLYASKDALLSVRFSEHGNQKNLSCNFIGPKSDSDLEHMRSLALPHVNSALIRAVRLPNDGSAKQGGFFAIGKQRKMEIAFGRQVPELTMFSVRLSFKD